MAEIARRVRALREGDDAAKAAAARALGDLACGNNANQGAIAAAGAIPPLVKLLRDGSADAKGLAAGALGDLACNAAVPVQVLIAEAGGIPPLVELLRDGNAEGKYWAVGALDVLTCNNDNKALIAEAGGIPPLVELLRDRDGSLQAKAEAAGVLRYLARDNDANAVAIAAAVGFDAVAELARGGRVTVDNRSIVRNAGVPAKRKAALVVATLLRDYVPEFKSAPRDIKTVIGPYL